MKIRAKTKKFDGSDSLNGVTYGEIYGVSLFGSSEASLLNLVEEKWSKQVQWVATVNPEFIMNALKDRDFLNILQKRTTVNVVDGVGLVWGNNYKLRITNYELLNKTKVNPLFKLYFAFVEGVEILMGKHRETIITGADLIDKFCKVAEEKGRTVYFFGGWGDRAKKTADYFVNKYPKLKVTGAADECFDLKSKADYLFVARGMKKQEEWINQNLEKLNVNLVMGVGRSFDYYSGDLKRAPMWLRKMGLEWLFSLIMEPKRWRRQLELPKFIWRVLSAG